MVIHISILIEVSAFIPTCSPIINQANNCHNCPEFWFPETAFDNKLWYKKIDGMGFVKFCCHAFQQLIGPLAEFNVSPTNTK